MDETRTDRRFCAGEQLQTRARKNASVRQVTFAPDYSAIGCRHARLLTDGDAIVEYLGFL